MAEFTTVLINGQHAACNSVLIDLAKAKRRWTEKTHSGKPKRLMEVERSFPHKLA
jgi:hypothetical protein